MVDALPASLKARMPGVAVVMDEVKADKEREQMPSTPSVPSR